MIPRDLTLTREGGETSLPLFAVVSNFARLNLPAHKHVSDAKKENTILGNGKIDQRCFVVVILVNIGIRAKRNEFHGVVERTKL